MRYSGIGGQAVMEGVMMKNQEKYAVAVRKPDQEIVVETSTYEGLIKNKKIRNMPILRGVFSFIESLVLGMKTLTFSASFFEEEEDEKSGSRKAEKRAGAKKPAPTEEEQKKKEKRQENVLMGGTAISHCSCGGNFYGASILHIRILSAFYYIADTSCVVGRRDPPYHLYRICGGNFTDAGY